MSDILIANNTTTWNNVSIKQINRNNVYNFIYNERQTCKSIITSSLKMGLSTVNQNIKMLEEEKLICKKGWFDSTGGRKANTLEIVPLARISIGVAVLRDIVFIVATNLYGEVIADQRLDFPFTQTDKYYTNLGFEINYFIKQHSLNNILGVSIATQGIVSKNGEFVTYGKILDNHRMQLSDFSKHIRYPCRLEHDSKSAAFLELWQNKFVTDGVILLLNHNIGGAIVTNSTVKTGIDMRSGAVEHMSLNFEGELCYCGRRGCLETYCSGEALEKRSQLSILEFFDLLHKQNEHCVCIWNDYLRHLAFAIRNVSVIIDGYYILSGLIAEYITPQDIDIIVNHITRHSPFDFNKDRIIVGHTGESIQAIGTSLYYIKEFLANI